ncbi:MAG TPA: glycosyltransferase family 2 protein [Patescibacteria group bacterium]
MKIAIVVLNYNLKEATFACLGSLQSLNKGENEIEIIVIDNNSEEDISKEITQKFPEAVFLQSYDNFGYSGGNNLGIRKALNDQADAVLVLNPDTEVDKDLITELVKVLETDQKIGIVAPKIYFYPGFETHKDRYKKEDLGKIIWYAGGKFDAKNVLGSHTGVDEADRGQFDKISQTDFATGAALLIKRDVFEKAGFFDEKYFLYLEDLDFSLRVKKRGFKILFAPRAIVYHKNAQSTGLGSSKQDYFITRNRLLFGLKYSTVRTKFALMRESLKFLLGPNSTKRKAVIDFYLGKFGKGSLIK